MSRSIFLPASIHLANPNRVPPARRSPSPSIACFSAGAKTPSSDSATYTTASSGKLYSPSVSPVPSIPLFLNHRPSPELGLASCLFVLSAVFGAFVSLGLIMIPAIPALRKLGISASKLEKVVAREVPGTLLSLKLSGMEISQVAQILSNMRRTLTGVERGSRGMGNNQGRTI